MKIAFHDNSLSLFGTTVATYKWAYWGRELLGIDPIIMYNSTHHANNNEVINKFKKTFNDKVYCYSNFQQIDDILKENNCEYFFMEKCGRPDGVISTVSKNLINAIAICQKSDVHGDVFAMGSKWLSSLLNYEIPYVPYIVTLVEENENLREELGIPNNAFVFARNGGNTTFDINFVKEAIREIIDKRNDIWFLFQCTDKFIEHERVIFLPCSSDENYKAKFINTCDAMIHARTVGESFGMACGEFSLRNKPVVTWFGSLERSHIDILDNKGIYYNNKEDLLNIFLNMSHNDTKNKNWNCYEDYSPEKVMKQFKDVYLSS